MRLHLTRIACALALATLTATALTAQRTPNAIEVTGSGIIGTNVDLQLRGASGDRYVLYVGVIPGPVGAVSGQRLGVGQAYLPVATGTFDSSGSANVRIPVPDIAQLVGVGIAFFQFETFRIQLVPPALVPTGVSPGAFVVMAPKGSGNPTTFGCDPTTSAIGSTLTLRMKGTPGDFVVGYWGTTAAPIVLDPIQTVVGVIPVATITPLLAAFDAQGDYSTTFTIPDTPVAIGVNAYFQFQTFALVGFPPQLQLGDSSCGLFVTAAPK